MTRAEMKEIARMVAAEIMGMMNDQADRLMTVAEAGAFLGLRPATVREKKSEIGFVKRGKRLYFSERNLREYIRGKAR